VEPQVRIEGSHEVGVLLAVCERTEDAIGELADVALGPPEHERVRAEVVEHGDRAVAAHRAADDDGLFRLKEREVRAGRAALGTADAGRQPVVAARACETRAERFGVSARVDVSRELTKRRDDPGAGSNDARVGDELGHRYAKARRDPRVP
jgi:hypothetical protein